MDWIDKSLFCPSVKMDAQESSTWQRRRAGG